ncbi:exonuclease [Oleiphilus messinensis]|uniref:Exonuclease n=1 Tax=Oleiphilus messinensis TaxID=141451 RepID=A0A1Y0I5L8_9GAMM|nr:hypothetical protein [Oleiphilus messinensis]ARU55540.1 exonuclease [Oleiphilus messinensis]
MKHQYTLITLLLIVFALPCRALDYKLALLHGDEEVFSYELSVIRLALKYTDQPHTLELLNYKQANQSRILRLLQQPNGPVNFFFTGFSPEREKNLLQIDFPLTRGLLGHRIFVIKKQDLPLFKSIASLEDLKKGVVVGSGIGWPDTDVFILNGFTVQQASYQSLWKMLQANRFTGINRGVHEAYVEIRQQTKQYPQFVVDPSVMVIYNFDYFVYVSPHHPELFHALKKGMQVAYESGAFHHNFNTHPQIQTMLEQLQPEKRKTFYLDNPLLSDRIKALPQEYWLRLQ